VLIGVAGEYWQLLLFLVGLGIVAGTYHAPAASLLARAFPPESRGGALGMHTVGGNLSFFATPLVAGGLVYITATWRTPYVAFAIAPLVAGVFLLVTAPRAQEREQEMAALYAALLAFLALFFVDVHGFSPPAAAFMLSVPFIGGLLGSPLGGALSDRLGRKPIIVISLVALGPLLLLLSWAPTLFLVPILLGIGLVASLRMPVIEGWLLDRAPADRRATTLGAYYFISQEFGGLAAPALGVLAGAIGIGQAFGGIALAMAGISVVILAVQHRL
jgi:MFS transporter, FSR family, fosmidomycin resistance protein